MIRLSILGVRGRSFPLTLRDLPLEMGRGPECGLRLEEAAVWDKHAVLSFKPRKGFFLQACPGASVVVNGSAVDSARLANGDLLDLGGVRLQFGFAGTRQSSFRARERLTWLAIAMLCAVQVALVYLFLP